MIKNYFLMPKQKAHHKEKTHYFIKNQWEHEISFFLQAETCREATMTDQYLIAEETQWFDKKSSRWKEVN